MQEEFKAILNRYKAGTASEEDIAFLESWYMQYNEAETSDYMPADQIADAGIIWNELKLGQSEAKRQILWARIAAAASILFCVITIGGYFLLHSFDGAQFVAVNSNNVIAPATPKATLKLPGGKSIILSAMADGLISLQNGVISKVADSELIYHSPAKSVALVYDTLITPRGGHFELILADGTKAWLNAATVIRYPETFSGKERRIELIRGEAYFEVIHNKAMPFKVATRNQLVEDIGTHFNINAYDDEPNVETTLLEGSVSVTLNKNQTVLKPGQQSIIGKTTSPIVVKKANIEKAVAWKNNHFVFDGESIQSIMQQLSRWYDVDVIYRGDMSGKTLTGSMPRNEKLSETLRKLQETGSVHFRVTARKITVLP